VTLWEIDIYPAAGQSDRLGNAVASDAADLGISSDLSVSAARGFLLQGEIDEAQANQLARELFADGIVERTVVAHVGDGKLNEPPNGKSQLLHVMLKPGVMDPVAQSAINAIADFGWQVEAVRTFRKFWLPELDADAVATISSRILANDSIEQVVVGPLELDQLQIGSPYEFELLRVAIRELDDEGLLRLSREGQLYLTLVEMQTIQNYFCNLERDPTDAELESIAQTWSEHCSHKTLAGRIAYRDENGEQLFENMLKETIFAATQQIRRDLGDDDWCVSVFEDNAGIVRFDDEYNVVFKVETHNHPSALEPYGGANTGIGGVIRDPMGTGLGAKPICNTDVFCFAPPDISTDDLPPGVLHPRRVMKGVVSGVRDYGNRMGIPTVNGAIYFDERYLGNPLVYCGDVGLIPRDKSSKEVMAGDWIVSIGGRTGRDGIHGATFSSAELTSESESLSGGAVQIGNAITEKMVLDVTMQARDRGLYSAVTDCGAGGFSSAVGEMGEKTGAEVWLDKAPTKYDGLSYTEIWISEAQERMVFSVPPENWDEFESLCSSESVEASIVGKFVATGRLQLKYEDNIVADLPMELLHDGRPPIVRDAIYDAPTVTPLVLPVADSIDLNATLRKILGSLNVASKEWVIRQYDHEVQGGSVIKPLVGVENDGPGDAAVVRPVLSSYRGLAVSCGMNPHYGDFDTYHMAASAIDEAIRNCVAVGADPSHISILDNFCWGYTDRPETLGSLVRAAIACRDLAVAFGTPFISGKDSLNNEFSYEDADGKQTISIPPSLLISAMGQVEDVRKCVTMDLKEVGNKLYIVGLTSNELGGSHFSLVEEREGGEVPKVDTDVAKRTFAAMHQAILAGCIRACHDLSEGGLAVGIAEMAFAGGRGVCVSLAEVPNNINGESDIAILFAESNSRFLCEVAADKAAAFEQLLSKVPHAAIGAVTDTNRVVIANGHDALLIDSDTTELKESWQSPLRW
jgi:phosphoribosylformylglycinamidine synthase subunit PurSL